MNFESYLAHFEHILHQGPEEAQGLYTHEGYMEYTKLNWSRMNRWMKTGVLNDVFIHEVKAISARQEWIVITEPWCGDAAHIVPFIEMASRHNPLVEIRYELRDTAPFRIEQYLTNGSKSIPKFIIRDVHGKDLGVWGPRPAACQQLYDDLKAAQAPFEEIKTEIQQWYNADKGQKIQEELGALLQAARS